jgi:hypothetical protein
MSETGVDVQQIETLSTKHLYDFTLPHLGQMIDVAAHCRLVPQKISQVVTADGCFRNASGPTRDGSRERLRSTVISPFDILD